MRNASIVVLAACWFAGAARAQDASLPVKEKEIALPGTGASQYQPNGTYYFSNVSGTHRGWLQGPATADFDLYLQKWNGFWWVTVAVSESVTSTEQIAYTGTPGYYRWRVYSYSGSGAYTFWLQRP